MERLDRAFAITVALEAALIMYGALSAFLTPSDSHEHNVSLAVVLVGTAALLAWYAASVAFNVKGWVDPLALRVIIANGALLMLCFHGSLESEPQSSGLLSALAACVAVAMIVGAIGRTRARLSRDAGSVGS